MKHWVTLLSIALVAGSASAKPEATRQASMTNGIRSVSKADSGKNTVYGYIMPMTFTKDEIGKMFEFVVDSPKPVVIQMWNGLISKTDTEWEKRRGFMGASGEPSKTPSFKFLAEKGSVTLMVLATLPPGSRPEPFYISYGKEVRTPTEQDKAEVQKAAAQAALARERAAQAKRPFFTDFIAKATDGKPLNTKQLRGRVILIDFWASWCGPCMEEMPNLVEIWNSYRGQEFEIVGISLDQDQAAMVQAITDTGMGWRQVFDGKGWDAELADKYGIKSIPASYLLDGTGRIIARDLRGPALAKAVASAVEANKVMLESIRSMEDAAEKAKESAKESADTLKSDAEK